MQWEVVVPSDWLLSVVQEPFARLHLTACTAESNQWLLLRVSWGRVWSWLIFTGTLKMSQRTGFHQSRVQVRESALGLECVALHWKQKRLKPLFYTYLTFSVWRIWDVLMCLTVSGAAAWGVLTGMTNCVHLRQSYGMLVANYCMKQCIIEDILHISIALLYLRTRMRTAASGVLQQSCRLSSGVSMCSVTTTPGVSLITDGSKGHELHSSGDSLQTPEKQLLL